MAPKDTCKGGKKSLNGGDHPNSKADTDTEAIAMAKADSDNASMDSTAGPNKKRRRESNTTNEASDDFLASVTVVTATSAGASGKAACTSGVPSDVNPTIPTISLAAMSRMGVVAAETARSIALEVYGVGDAGGKIGAGAGAMPTMLPERLGTSPEALAAAAKVVDAAGAKAADGNAAHKSVISSTARANKSDVIKEENFYLLQWLYRIRRVSCARGLLIGFLQPDFLWSMYRPMMRSAKQLRRTDGDIRVAADLWCFDRAAAEDRYGHISDWDVSSVTDMSELFRELGDGEPMEDRFRGTDLFNDDISRWDMSKVTNMRYMFAGARAFNQPIGNWDVSNVTDMSEMFSGARAFNQPVGDWDMSEVTGMSGMFSGARAFNQPVGDWDVSKVTNMSYMFYHAHSFNQPVENWDVSQVTQMHYMFYQARFFNQDLTTWDMRSVRSTLSMFAGAHAMQADNLPAVLHP